MFAYLSSQAISSFFHVRVVESGDYHASAWVLLAYTRNGGPTLNMIRPAILDRESNSIQMSRDGGVHAYQRATSFVATLFKSAGRDHGVEYILIAPAPVNKEMRRINGDDLPLAPDWMVSVSRSEQVLFPPSVHVEPRAGPFISMVPGLKGLPSLKHSKPKPRRSGPGVVLVDPRVRRGGGDGPYGSDDASGSEAASDVDRGDASDRDSDVDHYIAAVMGMPGVVVGGGGGGDDDGGDGPLCRKHPFGPWSISEIWPKGPDGSLRHSGWGANCGRHWYV